MMRTVCKQNSCTGCMACVGKCKKKAISIQDSFSAYNAIIDEGKCVNCGACERVCPNINKVKLNAPIYWKEGWASDDVRMKASSGGAASAMMELFVNNGGFVAACLFRNGEFLFDITNKKDELIHFSGSKYVKSNPFGIYDKVIEKLKNGNKVLFIGLPCQVAAIKNYTKVMTSNINENLYTVDLICHGTPSPKIFNLALSEKGIDIKQLREIYFRNKTNFGLSSKNSVDEYKTITPSGVQDMYTYAFLTSLDYTENCYSCQYATFGRVSDVTIGDSWGSNQHDNEQGKGISLILCQTNKGVSLIQNSGMRLGEVDIEKAKEANHQLKHPSIAPKTRGIFFENLSKGFYKAISKSSPKEYYKQKLKEKLIKFKNLRGGEKNRIEYKISFR